MIVSTAHYALVINQIRILSAIQDTSKVNLGSGNLKRFSKRVGLLTETGFDLNDGPA